MMASSISNMASVHNNRNGRFASFDQMSTLNSPLDLGTSFGPAANGWKTSIWADVARGNTLDGAADRERPNEMPANNGKSEGPIQGKTGSGSLLHSSESEGWNRRSGHPWPSSTTNSAAPIQRSSEGVPGVRQHINDLPGMSSSDLNNHNNHTTNSTGRNGTYRAVGEPALQTLGWNALRPSSSSALDPNSYPALGESRPVHASNLNSVAKNNFDAPLLPSTSARRPFTSGSQEASPPVFNVFQPTTSSRTNSEQTNFLQRSFAQKPDNSTSYSPSRHSFQSDAVDHNFQDMAFTRDERDENLISELERLNLHAAQQLSQTTQSHHRPHTSWQMPSYESPFDRQNRSASESYFSAGPQHNSISPAPERGPQHTPTYHRNTSFATNGGGSYSPSIADSRRELMTPFTSTASTPPLDRGSVRTNSRSGSSRGGFNGQMLDRKLRGLQAYPNESMYYNQNPLQMRAQYQQQGDVNNPSSMPMNPLARPYPMPGYNPYAGVPPGPAHLRTYHRNDNDAHQVIRSPLLEDFRTNSKTNKKFELKDIYNHVVEFSGDQYGSRFIQLKLETANSDEKEQVFMEIQPNAIQLMTDVFGNYVIQKMFEHGNQTQKKVLANQMKGHIITLSTQMYGCRVVQKALEHVLVDQQASIVKELDGNVLRCVRDQNGNHVVQKAIERVPAQHIDFIILAFQGQVARLAAHPYGCRVIQRMLEHCEPLARQSLLAELQSSVDSLIQDQFGNYVMQHIIEHGEAKDRFEIISVVMAKLFVLSRHKFASNVVEKSIDFGEVGQRAEMLRMLSTIDEHGVNPALSLLQDQYGNYVIQKVLSHLKGNEREVLVDQIRAQLIQLRKFNYGKQVNAIEKVIAMAEQDDHSNRSGSTPGGSTLPSTNASTVEGPTGTSVSSSSGNTSSTEKAESTIVEPAPLNNPAAAQQNAGQL